MMIHIISIRPKKGSYEAVTGFFFAVILVAAVLLLVANNLIVTQQQLFIIQQNQDYLNTNVARERIVGCHGTTVLDLSRLENSDCTYGEYLKAYTIEVLPSEGCDYQTHQFPLREEPINMRTIYYLPVRGGDTQIVCMARLTIEV